MKKTSLSPRAEGRFFRQNCEIFGIFAKIKFEIFGKTMKIVRFSAYLQK